MRSILLVFSLLIISLIGCRTVQPINWAKECADRFPPRTDTFRLTTETVKFDTVKLPSETVYQTIQTVCPPSDTVTVIKTRVSMPSENSQLVRKTIIMHDSIVISKANTALDAEYKSDIDSLKSQLAAQKAATMSLVSDIEGKKRQIHRFVRFLLFSWLIFAILGISSYLIWKRI